MKCKDFEIGKQYLLILRFNEGYFTIPVICDNIYNDDNAVLFCQKTTEWQFGFGIKLNVATLKSLGDDTIEGRLSSV